MRRLVVLIRGMEGNIGPGRLTKALSIGEPEKNIPVCEKSNLSVEPGTSYPTEENVRKPRIGIHYAEEWVKAPLRWAMK
jgi:3-methyladenine DNA glycosylase Mpg